MIENPMFKTTATLAVILGLWTITVILITKSFNGAGIIPHPSGKAVFLQGESCVVNADDGVDQHEYIELLEWCKTQR